MKKKQTNINEKALVEQLRGGDEKAFEIIFNAYFNMLFSYACNFLERPFLAEDIVEDVFFRLWERRETLEIKGSLPGYLFTSVKNACLDHTKSINVRQDYEKRVHKKTALEENITLASSTPVDPLQYKELRNTVKKAVESLPAEYKKVFKMSSYYKMTNKEIAVKLGLSSHTVGKYLKKAIDRLKKSLLH